MPFWRKKGKNGCICGVCHREFETYNEWYTHYEKEHPAVVLSERTEKILCEAEKRVEQMGYGIWRSSDYLACDATGVRKSIGIAIERGNLDVDDVVNLLINSRFVYKKH